jgi:integrase
MAKRAKEASPRTANKEILVLSHFFTIAIRDEYVTLNPVAAVKKFKVIKKAHKWLEIPQVNALVAAATLRIKPMVALASFAGLRLGEIVNLRWQNIDLDNRMLTISADDDWGPKSNQVRQLAIASPLFAVLHSWHSMNNKMTRRHRQGTEPEDYVVSFRGNQVGSIRKAFFAALDKAGLPRIRFHDLRHTFGSNLAKAGVPLYDIALAMGHSDIKTTQIYAHLSPGYMSNVTKVFDNIIEEKSQPVSVMKMQHLGTAIAELEAAGFHHYVGATGDLCKVESLKHAIRDSRTTKDIVQTREFVDGFAIYSEAGERLWVFKP